MFTLSHRLLVSHGLMTHLALGMVYFITPTVSITRFDDTSSSWYAVQGNGDSSVVERRIRDRKVPPPHH